MTKGRAEIDIVPMFPSRERAGFAIELLLIASTPCAAILAVMIVLVSRMWGLAW